MSDVKPKSEKALSTVNSITLLFGSNAVLPGESAEEYQQGQQSVIAELEAKTVMQVYLAEKIFECLWWMRRYELQKRAILAREMGRILGSIPEPGIFSQSHADAERMIAAEVKNMEIILDLNQRNEFEKLLKKSKHTETSLMQEAFSNKSERIGGLDEKITVLLKNLSGFQASYEVLVNRKLNIERMRMQNELLSQNLNAIVMEASPDASQSEKKSSK